MTSTEQWEALRIGEIAFAYGTYAPDDASLRSLVLARTRIGVLLPGDHRLVKKAKLKVEDLANESILMGPRRLHPRLHDDIISAVRARGVVLNLAPEVLDREALWTLVASGLGLTFAGERSASFLDVGWAIREPGLLLSGLEAAERSRRRTTRRRDVAGRCRAVPPAATVDRHRGRSALTASELGSLAQGPGANAMTMRVATAPVQRPTEEARSRP
jgi:DNA-binding transcriptional LysR family regulator